MSLLYKDEKDVTYSVEFSSNVDGIVKLSFTCDGGKLGAEESLAEHEVTVLELLTALNDWAKKQVLEVAANGLVYGHVSLRF